MQNKMDNEPVIVFSGTALEVSMVKSILDDNEIASYLRDEYIGTIAPWYSGGGGAGSVKIVVAAADSEKALKVIEEYNRNIK